MKSSPISKTIHLVISLSLLLLLSNQALACFFPSPMEMSEGRAMACCTDSCRMETTPEVAKQVCDQTRQAVSQDDPPLNQAKPYVSTMGKTLLDSAYFFPVDPTIRNQIHSSPHAKVYALSKRFISVEIHTLFRSFLI